MEIRGDSCPPDVLVVRFIEMRAFAVAGPGGLRVGVGTPARGPPGNLGGLGVDFFNYILLE